ncbi:MAG TPA: hypothetical protein VFI81_04060, partial [Rhodanobacteraceae bacterium]|nr:hypothetical protein [Rhodanobacteraceae bacterium]
MDVAGLPQQVIQRFTSAFSPILADFPSYSRVAAPRSATETDSMNLRSFVVRLGGAAMLAMMLALAACNGTVRGGGETTVNVPHQYDMTIGTFKDNQYQVDGAVLSAPDLE